MRRLSFAEFALVMLQLGLVLLVGWGYQRQFEEQDAVTITRDRMRILAEHLRDRPTVQNLKELCRLCNLKDENLEDSWGYRMKYDETEQIVYSTGADGIKGGSGFAADLSQRVAYDRVTSLDRVGVRR